MRKLFEDADDMVAIKPKKMFANISHEISNNRLSKALGMLSQVAVQLGDKHPQVVRIQSIIDFLTDGEDKNKLADKDSL